VAIIPRLAIMPLVFVFNILGNALRGCFGCKGGIVEQGELT